MTAPDLKTIFDAQFDQVKFDRSLCERIIRYSLNYMTRNDDHNAFFGGVLTGVHPIRFLNSDRERWYEEVLDIDEDLFVDHFRKNTFIDHSRNVQGDPFNYTPIYVCHRLGQETRLPQKLRQEAMMHAFMVLHYRYLTSLLVRRFRYPADPEVARAVYDSLNMRFDIRRYGSWRKLLEARSEELASPNSIHHRSIKRFAPDEKVSRVVTDTQGRIRELVKKLYEIHLQARDRNHRVTTSSATTITMDGEKVLKDRKSQYGDYLRYLESIIPERSSFIRQELVDVVSNAMHTMPPQLLTESLEYLSANYGGRGKAYLETVVKETLLYVFDYLQSNRQLLGRSQDLPGLLTKLRALLMASRSRDPSVLKLRRETEKLIKASVKTRNTAVIASVRTGVLLYIALRALTRQHYSQ